VADTRVNVSSFPRHTETVVDCLMTSGPAVRQPWSGDCFRFSGATLMLKRLTLYSHRDAHTRAVSGGAFTDAPGSNPWQYSGCPTPTSWSTRRRHRSLHTPCSHWASRVNTTERAVDAPGQSVETFERGTVRMAACAGWTEVVIPRDIRCLCDLPVSPFGADANTRSGYCPKTARPTGGGAVQGGADDRRGRKGRRLVTVSRRRSGSTRCDESLSFWGGDGISCQNNQEVTL
jgi:hypothetical protein